MNANLYYFEFFMMNYVIVFFVLFCFLFFPQTSSDMKLFLAAIVLFLIVETNAQWYKFPGQAVQGRKHLHNNNMYNCDVTYLLC